MKTPKVGDRVRLTRQQRQVYLARGIEPSQVEGMSVPGVVVWVESSKRYGWTSVHVRHDSGKEYTYSPEQLEPAPRGRRANPGWQSIFDNPTSVASAMRKIRALHDDGVSWEAAARTFMIRYPNHALDVMDRVGTWPSSEPEIRALQEVWR